MPTPIAISLLMVMLDLALAWRVLVAFASRPILGLLAALLTAILAGFALTWIVRRVSR